MLYVTYNSSVNKNILLPLLTILIIISTLAAPSLVRAATYKVSPNSDLIGDIEIIFNDRNESFATLAQRYSVSFNELVAANPRLDPWVPGQTNIIIPNHHILPVGPRVGIVINLAELRLYHFSNQGKVVHTFPVGIGKQGWQTPTAKTKIIEKKTNPQWRAPKSIIAAYAKRGKPISHVIPPGPDNPLGKYALRLALPGYLIHGTNNPMGVGRRISHGCVRMYPDDIKALFDLVKVGTKVRIVHLPTVAGVHHGRVYVQAAPEQLEFKTNITNRHGKLLEMVEQIKASIPSNMHDQIDLPALKPLLQLQNGVPFDLTKI